MTNGANTLRIKLKENQILRVAGAFDAMSAKLVELSNFDAVWAGSFAISATHALPDASILTMTDFLKSAENMVDACNIPVIADCDTGFGGPSNVDYMIKKYENAGVAGVSIEDKTFPKQNSLLEDGKQELLSEKDFVAKIIAGKTAKNNPNFMIIARIDSLILAKGMDDALYRAKAYIDAGADAIMINSQASDPKEVFEFCDHYNSLEKKVLLAASPDSYNHVTEQELSEHGIQIIIYSNNLLRAAYPSMTKVAESILTFGRSKESEQDCISIQNLIRFIPDSE